MTTIAPIPNTLEDVEEIDIADEEDKVHEHQSSRQSETKDGVKVLNEHQSSPESESEEEESTRFSPKITDRWVIVDIMIYVTFLAVFSGVVLNLRDPLFAYQYNAYMKDLFLFEEFPGPSIYKTFLDVATVEEFWEYVSSVWVTQLLSDQGAGAGVMYGTNYLVGAARLRQVRIKPKSNCNVVGDFTNLISACYPIYDDDVLATTAYGPNNTWQYRSGEELNTNKQMARLRRYDGGGYVVLVGGGSAPDTDNTIQTLVDHNWVDLHTRAVFIDWTVFNPGINLFLVAQLHFEFLPSGGVYPDYKFRVVRLYRYEGVNGTFQLVGEICILLYVLVFILQTGVRVWRDGHHINENEKMISNMDLAERKMVRQYVPFWKNAWNYADIITIMLFLVTFAVRMTAVSAFNSLKIAPADRSRFFNFQGVVLWDATESNLLASSAIVLWFKVFRYSHFEPRTGMIASVLSKAFKPLVYFIIMFLFVIFGFSQAGTLAFGSDVDGYRTFSNAIMTSLQATLGLFEFHELRHSNRAFGPFFFLTFIVLVYFILMSVFVAIVNSAYEETSAEIAENKKSSFLAKAVAWASTTSAGRRAAELLAMEQELELLQQEVLEADANNDGLLDIDELKTIMKDAEFCFDGDIETIMAKYDVNQDGGLEDDEQAQMLEDLQQKHSEVALKLKTLQKTAREDTRLLFELVTDRTTRMEKHLEGKIDAMTQSIDAAINVRFKAP